MRRILLFVTALLWPAVAVHSEIWYVSQTSGNDGNAGNVSNAPLKTLNGLESHFGSSDTAYITGTFNESNNGRDHAGDYYRGGLYLSGLNDWMVTQWPDSARPRFLGNPPPSGCIWPPNCIDSDTGWNGVGMEVLSCRNFTIKNIDFRHMGRGVFMDNDTTFEIRGCTFDSIFGGPCFSGGTGFCGVSDPANCGNALNFGSVFVGYDVDSKTNPTRYGRITNCAFGAALYSICTWGGPWSLDSSGQNGGSIFSYRMGYMTIDSNTFGSYYTQIYAKGECHYNTIQYNTFTHAGGHGGVYLSADIKDTVRYNLFQLCAIGITLNGYINSTPYMDTAMIYNNTFYGDGQCIHNSCDDKQVRGTRAFNNIFCKFSSRALGFEGWNGSNNILTSTINYWDENVYDITTGSTKFTFNDVNYTFATWNSSLGWDGNSVNATPDFFVDTTASGGRDFHLNTSGASYGKLSTGGRGGAWPSYIGAFGSGSTPPPAVLPPLPLRKRARK